MLSEIHTVLMIPGIAEMVLLSLFVFGACPILFWALMREGA
jgi:hypothetical protein